MTGIHLLTILAMTCKSTSFDFDNFEIKDDELMQVVEENRQIRVR
ncbi:MAG: hypothetical protein ACTSPR_02170 [Candidatus Thorarchaeota archaeon]